MKAGDPVSVAFQMARERSYWVYILASKLGCTLYIGVTNDLVRRVYGSRKKMKAADGFTKKYEVDRLIYFEQFDDIENAIHRESDRRNVSLAWKVRLIEEA